VPVIGSWIGKRGFASGAARHVEAARDLEASCATASPSAGSSVNSALVSRDVSQLAFVLLQAACLARGAMQPIAFFQPASGAGRRVQRRFSAQATRFMEFPPRSRR